MKKTKHILLILLTFSLTSCASLKAMHEEWLVKHCTSLAGYNQGLRDGLTPNQMPEYDYARECSANRDVINSEYLRGFGEGVKSRPQEININKNVNVTTTNKTV
ncbi:MAG TPA: hypothetical protein VJL60_00665 [Gammaproteobacteria bacterium]|nr:hypothetical protein [Gammaproteobacteria bacterium]